MTITPAELATTPVVAGLFATEAGRAHLIGSRCLGCGTLYFPQAISCRNPHCHDKTIEQTALPNRGILYSFTVQRYRPPPLFQMDDWQPYAIGVVDLGQGLHVMGMLTDIAGRNRNRHGHATDARTLDQRQRTRRNHHL